MRLHPNDHQERREKVARRRAHQFRKLQNILKRLQREKDNIGDLKFTVDIPTFPYRVSPKQECVK